MKHVAASEVKNRFGQFLESALVEPVAITKSGRSVAVMMSMGYYQRLQAIHERWLLDRALEAEQQGVLSAEESEEFLAGIVRQGQGSDLSKP